MSLFGLYLLVTSTILWHLENMLTLSVCMYCNECYIIGIIWQYSHIWVDSRSDTVYGPVSETVKICLGKVLKKSLFLS